VRAPVWRWLLLAVGIALAAAAALRWRGFRATTPPSRLEAVLARSVRDLAIPAAQRRLSNPLAANAANLEAGREDFRQHCASCHGRDGRGQTALGGALYPRVPDLRAAATQALSDGELHYLIAYGVQLTGMPAWTNALRHQAADNWKDVLYLRSLRPLDSAERGQQARLATAAHYVGSAACQPCHQQIYAHWKSTPMANVVRDPRQHPHAIIPSLASDTAAHFDVSQVAFVYGSIWKQRFFTKRGDNYYPLPAQWDILNHKWLPYTIPAKGADWWVHLYPSTDAGRPTGPTCDGCHSVGYNIQTKQVAEWNVGCERCHGPGSEHVAHPSRGNILNPARLDAVAASDTCIQCHSQGRALGNPIGGLYYDWPVGYNVDLRLEDYWKLEGHTLGQTNFYYYADGTAHKNRMHGNDFAQSVMYRRGVTCFSCHDVHGTGNGAELIQPAQQLCLDCHSPGSPNGPREATLEAHTHHASGSPGSQCVACHMPQIQSEGTPGAYVHAHTFRFIAPAMTEAYGIPNPCTTCHKGKSTAWATSALRQWAEISPWRIQ